MNPEKTKISSLSDHIMERLDEHGIERYNQISALAIAYMKVCIRKGLSHRDIMSIINTAYDAHGREYT